MDWSNPVEVLRQQIIEIEEKFAEHNLPTDLCNDRSRLQRMKANDIDQFFKHMEELRVLRQVLHLKNLKIRRN